MTRLEALMTCIIVIIASFVVIALGIELETGLPARAVIDQWWIQ